MCTFDIRQVLWAVGRSRRAYEGEIPHPLVVERFQPLQRIIR